MRRAGGGGGLEYDGWAEEAGNVIGAIAADADNWPSSKCRPQ